MSVEVRTVLQFEDGTRFAIMPGDQRNLFLVGDCIEHWTDDRLCDGTKRPIIGTIQSIRTGVHHGGRQIEYVVRVWRQDGTSHKAVSAYRLVRDYRSQIKPEESAPQETAAEEDFDDDWQVKPAEETGTDPAPGIPDGSLPLIDAELLALPLGTIVTLITWKHLKSGSVVYKREVGSLSHVRSHGLLVFAQGWEADIATDLSSWTVHLGDVTAPVYRPRRNDSPHETGQPNE